MGVRERRQDALISELRTSDTLTANDLSRRLGVSVRSVRDYVRDLNQRHGRTLVVADQTGYRLDPAEYHRYRVAVPATAHTYDGPEQRLYAIIRHLISHTDGADVFDLGDQLAVSPSTIEADLVRARELLREHKLAIERRRDHIQLIGPERQQRRLVRYLLLNAGQAVLDGSRLSLDAPQQRSRTRRLHTRATAALQDAGIDVNEYVLNDLLLHIAIAADRVAGGHQLGAVTTTSTPPPDDALWQLAQELSNATEAVYGVELPVEEQLVIRDVLRARSRAASDEDAARAVSTTALDITRDALREISGQFMLDLYDEATVTGLAIHVQNLIQRSRSGDALASPLGPTFQLAHPLIHELALLLAQEIERRANVRIAPGEVDFLAFHLGNQVQRQMDQGPPITITCVLPRYATSHEDMVSRLTDALHGQIVIQDVITSLSHDWQALTADLVVSVLDLDTAPVPVIRISPFLSQEDIDRVAEAVRTERSRAKRDRLRANLLSLLDPALFHHVKHLDKADTLARMSGSLQDHGYVGPGFLADVLDREARAATAFGGPFAIPHSMYMDAYKTGISVLVADEGIPWDTSVVRLVFMFAVSPDGRTIFRDVLDHLIELLGNPTNVDRLISEAADHHQFVRALVNLISS